MDRPRLIRGLRIAWSVVFGVLCVLLIVLWVRSYSRMDAFSKDLNSHQTLMIHSLNGNARIILTSDPRLQGRYFFGSESASAWRALGGGELTLPRTYLGFGVHIDQMNWAAMSPHWFLILLSITIAFTTSAWKYSLRTLLIATTLIAVLVGLVVWSIAR